MLRVHRWRLILVPPSDGSPGSNGIFPAERVDIAVGTSSHNSFFLPPGSLISQHRGKVFTYRAPRGTVRGIRTLRITRVGAADQDGIFRNYRLNFTLTGVLLPDLLIKTQPDCMPFAVIVGDDDGFSGVQLAEPHLSGRRFTIKSSCIPGGDWPWLG